MSILTGRFCSRATAITGSRIATERSVCPRPNCGVSTDSLSSLKPWKPLALVVVVVLLGIAVVEIDWNWRRQISPRGGRYFFHRVELAVPSFRQGDEKWNDDPLGGVAENGTIGGEGCAVAAPAQRRVYTHCASCTATLKRCAFINRSRRLNRLCRPSADRRMSPHRLLSEFASNEAG